MEAIRVFICGAHCTGKTTLLNDATDLTGIQGIQEVARRVYTERFSKEDLNYEKRPSGFKALQLEILKEQGKILSTMEGKDILVDRGIDPIIYTAFYLDEKAAEEIIATPAAQVCIERCKRKNTLVFVVDPHRELLTEDGVRMSPKMEDLLGFTKTMKGFLIQQSIPFHTISMLNRKERVNFVVDKIREFKCRLSGGSLDRCHQT